VSWYEDRIVLEIGFGSDLNLPFCDNDKVRRVWGLEPSEGMRRVLKPDGQLLYCEHGKAPDAGVHKWQQRLNPGWKCLAGGCNMHRDIPALLDESGFVLEDDNRSHIPGLRVFSYNYWGSARIR